MRAFAMGLVFCCASSCVDSPVLDAAVDPPLDAGESWPTEAGPRRPAQAASAADGGGLPTPTARELDPAAGGSGAGGARARAAPAAPAELAGAAADGGGGAPAAATPRAPPAPASTPRPARASALVISELMIDPRARSDAQGEWFELWNPGDSELDIYGCALADGSSEVRALPEHLLIAPRSYVVVARSEQPGFEPDLVASFSLKNGADSLELTCDGVSIDRVAYDKAQGFPVAAGAAMSLDVASVAAGENDLARQWCLAVRDYGGDLGSPAQPNPPCHDAAEDGGAGE